jgi:hypothetical protein
MSRSIACRRCGERPTWFEQKRQFARIVSGRTADEAKAVLPLCQKCTTLWLHDVIRLPPNEPTGQSSQ